MAIRQIEGVNRHFDTSVEGVIVNTVLSEGDLPNWCSGTYVSNFTAILLVASLKSYRRRKVGGSGGQLVIFLIQWSRDGILVTPGLSRFQREHAKGV